MGIVDGFKVKDIDELEFGLQEVFHLGKRVRRHGRAGVDDAGLGKSEGTKRVEEKSRCNLGNVGGAAEGVGGYPTRIGIGDGNNAQSSSVIAPWMVSTWQTCQHVDRNLSGRKQEMNF